MSVEITFEADEGHGLVAVGTSLWEASKRLGVSLPAECKGRGECDACGLLISQGSELLSPANELELKILGPERLGATERLACQARLVQAGEVIVRRAPVAARTGQKESAKALRDLPFKQQVGSFIETEATKISEALNALRGQSNALVEKFLNLKPRNPGPTHQSERDAPPPHH